MAKNKVDQEKINEYLDDFILDDIDWDDVSSKKDLITLAKETVIANCEEYGVESFNDLTTEQKAKVKEYVDDEWKSYLASKEDEDEDEYAKGGEVKKVTHYRNSDDIEVGDIIRYKYSNKDPIEILEKKPNDNWKLSNNTTHTGFKIRSDYTIVEKSKSKKTSTDYTDAPNTIAAIRRSKFKKGGKVEKAMEEFKEGKLKTSSGKKVTNRKQAIVIGLSEQKAADKKVPTRKRPAMKKGGKVGIEKLGRTNGNKKAIMERGKERLEKRDPIRKKAATKKSK